MSVADDSFSEALAAAAEGLVYLPLGGAGEIGMNLYLYGCAGKWLMVDLGISFAGETVPGVDIYMPDPGFIVSRREDLVGLVLTHAHEDHLGAVPYLWPKLRCPIYATPFAAGMLRSKLIEAGIEDEVALNEVPLGGRIELAPFSVELITLTHSIPEPNALAIRTPFGTVLHTGDWKIDPEPLIGEVTDEDALKDLGAEGPLAMICDSTNVFVDGEAGSESDVRAKLIELIGGYENRVAVACFASNVARVESIAAAAAANGRHAALVGRSLWRVSEVARECGYLKDVPPFLTEHDVGHLPPEEVLLICTGSQGEPGAALTRIAAGDHPNVVLAAGDVVLFSSRIIPGNEKPVLGLQNQLAGRGVEVITNLDQPIHVSGHPARGDLARMYQWVRPSVVVPMHGETRHLIEHAAFARACQVPEAIVATNGDVLRLAPGNVEVIAEVPSGRLALDGNRLVPLEGDVLRARRRMMSNGTAVATVVLDGAGQLMGTPRLSVHGLFDATGDEEDAEALDHVIGAIADAVDGMPGPKRLDDEAVAQKVRLTVRRALKRIRGKRPLTEVHVVRV
ncbi:MAG: ribonuclease J [Alphaproteobacteria bacterium]|nr:ribonuclease J [Alphaproteobacteria bacterium]